jgi:hypothetical protein
MNETVVGAMLSVILANVIYLTWKVARMDIKLTKVCKQVKTLIGGKDD